MVAFQCEDKNQFYEDLGINFKVIDSQISPTDLIVWHDDQDGPCAFLSIRHERYASSKMIEFGYFDTGLHNWVTKHSPCFAMIGGDYSIKVNKKDKKSCVGIYKNDG